MGTSARAGLIPGLITTQNLNPNSGVATPGSAIETNLFDANILAIQVVGTYTGALTVQVCLAGTNWVTIGAGIININTGSMLPIITSALQGIFQVPVCGAVKARVTALAAVTGSAAVTLKAIAGSTPALVAGGTLSTLAGGQSAHSSASTGTPVRVGGRVKTANDTTLAAGDACDIACTTDQAMVNKPFSPPELDWQYAAAASGIVNTTTAVTFKTAAGAGLRNYITRLDIATDGALGAATEVAIRDGAAGTVIWRMKIGTAGLQGGRSIEFPTPLKGTANTLLEVVTLTASTTGAVYVNAGGYVAP